MQQATTATITETAIVSLMKNYANYNLWANKTLVNWLRTKPESLLEQEMPSSFSSIKKTLSHILQTQQYWLSVLRKDEATFEGSEGSLDEVLTTYVKQSEEFAAFVDAMTAEQVTNPTLIVSQWFQCDFANFEYIMQVMNHSTYHRGQVTSIGRQLGFTDAPMTDYNFYNVYGKAGEGVV